jgi:Domain of unknown function (DUF1905)
MDSKETLISFKQIWSKKFEFTTVPIRRPRNFVFAEFPYDSIKEFETRRAVPVKVSCDVKEYEMNLLPGGNGRHRLQLRKEIRREIGKDEGDKVSVMFEINDSPGSVKVPDYSQWLLENDLKIMNTFHKLSYSVKSFWDGYIEEAKKI